MRKLLTDRNYSEGKLTVCRRVNQESILHKHYRAFLVFEQMKDLYVSGVIKNENGNLPYQSLAKYLKLSVSGLRGKIKQLKQYELIRVDKNKNIHLASWRRYVSIFRPQKFRTVKKDVYPNIAPADQVKKGALVANNFRAQEYMIKKKILDSEIKILVGAPKDRLTYPDAEGTPLGRGNSTPDGCSQSNNYIPGSKAWHTRPRHKKHSKPIRRLRAELMKDYDKLLWRYRQYYAEELETIETGYPAINPHITLSCAGVGRLLGIGTNAGYYQRSKMVSAGVLSIQSNSNYAKVLPVTPDTLQTINESGGNVFSKRYPTRRGNSGFTEKFHLSLPDELKLHPFFSYTIAKN